MDQAAKIQFGRIVDEYSLWCGIPEEDRSPAPGWWWGPAFEARGLRDILPAQWSTRLGLHEGATFAEGAEIFLKSLAGQTSLPWPSEFPGRQRPTDSVEG